MTQTFRIWAMRPLLTLTILWWFLRLVAMQHHRQPHPPHPMRSPNQLLTLMRNYQTQSSCAQSTIVPESIMVNKLHFYLMASLGTIM